MIESKSNEKAKYYRKLRTKKFIELENKFIVEGEHLVEEGIKSSKIQELIILEGKNYNANLPKTFVSGEVMKSISLLDTPQYVMGVAKKEKTSLLGKKIVILDGVSDPGNVGTIIRNSVAFDIDTIVFTNNTVNPYNDKVVRATQGMIFKTNIVFMNIEELFQALKEKEIKIYATVINGKTLENEKKGNSYAIVFGNEGSGISEYSKMNSDELITIEMNNLCESLNVGVASGIILYEFRG